MLELNKLYEREDGKRFCVVDIGETYIFTVDFTFVAKNEIRLEYSTLKAYRKDEIEQGFIEFEQREVEDI